MADLKTLKRNVLSSALSKVKLHDTGRKIGQSPVGPMKTKTVYYPSLRLDVKQLPDLKGKEVENKVCLMVYGTITSHSVDEGPNRSDESFSIDITKIGLMPMEK